MKKQNVIVSAIVSAIEIEFIRWLSSYDRSRQKLATEKGQVIRFVVQYEAYIDER